MAFAAAGPTVPSPDSRGLSCLLRRVAADPARPERRLAARSALAGGLDTRKMSKVSARDVLDSFRILNLNLKIKIIIIKLIDSKNKLVY